MENHRAQVEEVILRLLRISDVVLGRMMSDLDKQKKRLYLTSAALVSLFIIQLLLPPFWNLIPLACIGVCTFFISRSSQRDRERHYVHLDQIKFLHGEIDDLGPLFQQEFVQDWQWEDYCRRKKYLNEKYQLFTDLKSVS